MNADLYKRVEECLDAEGLIVACQRAVRIPSLSGMEANVSAFMVELLKSLGADVVEKDANHNVVAIFRGSGSGPSLMYNGHLDHVPPGDMPDPYSGDLRSAEAWGERGQAIYGRGSCDMKCNVVAAAFALGAIRRAGVCTRGDAILVADVQEEIDSPLGIQSVLSRGLGADFGISVESTDLQVYVGHRGKVEFEIDVFGRSCHSSDPLRGVNAITEMARAIAVLDALGHDASEHPLLGKGSLAFTDIWARPGGGVAVVPDRCTVRVDRRFVPSETPESCRVQLEAALTRLPGLSFAVRQVNLYPLMYIDPDHYLVDTLRQCREAVLGSKGELGAWRFGVNGTFMAQAGIPTVGLGPGREIWAHTDQEHVLVQDLLDAARIYIMATLKVCGTAEH